MDAPPPPKPNKPMDVSPTADANNDQKRRRYVNRKLSKMHFDSDAATPTAS